MPEHRGRDLDLGAGKSAKGVDLCHIPAIKLNDYPRLTRAVLTHAGTESVIGCAVLFQRRLKGVVGDQNAEVNDNGAGAGLRGGTPSMNLLR
jgi:hypothetical protein